MSDTCQPQKRQQRPADGSQTAQTAESKDVYPSSASRRHTSQTSRQQNKRQQQPADAEKRRLIRTPAAARRPQTAGGSDASRCSAGRCSASSASVAECRQYASSDASRVGRGRRPGHHTNASSSRTGLSSRHRRHTAGGPDGSDDPANTQVHAGPAQAPATHYSSDTADAPAPPSPSHTSPGVTILDREGPTRRYSQGTGRPTDTGKQPYPGVCAHCLTTGPQRLTEDADAVRVGQGPYHSIMQGTPSGAVGCPDTAVLEMSDRVDGGSAPKAGICLRQTLDTTPKEPTYHHRIVRGCKGCEMNRQTASGAPPNGPGLCTPPPIRLNLQPEPSTGGYRQSGAGLLTLRSMARSAVIGGAG